MDTDLSAVPAKAFSEVIGGGTLLVHQQQTGKESLELQWDDSDLMWESINLITPNKNKDTNT